jgi:hypothetical protein
MPKDSPVSVIEKLEMAVEGTVSTLVWRTSAEDGTLADGVSPITVADEGTVMMAVPVVESVAMKGTGPVAAPKPVSKVTGSSTLDAGFPTELAYPKKTCAAAPVTAVFWKVRVRRSPSPVVLLGHPPLLAKPGKPTAS